jgi:hypothetical protein
MGKEQERLIDFLAFAAGVVALLAPTLVDANIWVSLAVAAFAFACSGVGRR